jgi:hypothetical protein
VENRTYLTAITRNGLSAPVKYLQSQGLLQGRTLDYGCGRGIDCDILKCEGYDPHYHPEAPQSLYNTIYCIYVLNVIPTAEERDDVLAKIKGLLTPDGTAYIAVRRDKKSLNGWTSRGTYQTNVVLPLPELFCGRSFAIYLAKK